MQKPVSNDQQARAKAAADRAESAAQAMKEHQARKAAVDANMSRLRTLRLARDAQAVPVTIKRRTKTAGLAQSR